MSESPTMFRVGGLSDRTTSTAETVIISGRFTSSELGEAAGLLEQLRQIRRWKRMDGGRRYLKAHYGSGRIEELFLSPEELRRILDMLEDSRVWKLRQMGVTDL